MKYGAFMHNFENFLERDNPDESRKLQLLIQHLQEKQEKQLKVVLACRTKLAIELQRKRCENFGKPYIIPDAHTKKLTSLRNIKNGDGPSLLQFARHLETAQRPLSGMGSSYVIDLNHMNTLRELVKKLLMYLRARWTELAGNLLEEDHDLSIFSSLSRIEQN